MNAVIGRPPLGRRGFLALAIGFAVLVSAFALTTLRAQSSAAAPVTKSAVLLETEEAPWGEEFDFEAMEDVFGTNWELQEFGGVQADEGAGGLFAPQVEFIWIEGSDESTTAASDFVDAHEAQLKAFVARGGSLFINAGTNEEVAVEYDGRSIGHGNNEIETEEAEVVDPSLQIFNEPDPLSGTSFTGDAFASGVVTGATVTPLLVNSEEGSANKGSVVLAIYTSGFGNVALGTMTAAQYAQPTQDAEALRVNLLTYLKEKAAAGIAAAHETTTVQKTQTTQTTQTTPTAQCVVPKLKGKTLKQAKAALGEAGCGLDKVARKPSVSLKKGKVIRQRPVPGTVRGAGSEVSFRLGHA